MTTVLVFAWIVFAVFFGAAMVVAHSDGASHRDAFGRLVWNNPTKERVAASLSAVGIVAGFVGVMLGLWSLAAWVTR